MSFSKLGLTPSLCLPLARLGYETPTPIQTLAIPAVLRGTDLLARAQTGTGKTAAFGLPMIERLVMPARMAAGPELPRGLVLVPTRELAAQVHRALCTYGAPAQLRVTAIFGGVGMGAQNQSLRQGTDIVVATPGRLIDHMQRRTVDLSAIEILTLDEADRMLDLGFLPALRRVIAVAPALAADAALFRDAARRSRPARGRIHPRPRTRGRLGRAGRRPDRDAPCASGRARSKARRAHARSDAGDGESSARLLQDEARLGSGWRAPRTRRHQGGRHPRQQEPGRTNSGTR